MKAIDTIKNKDLLEHIKRTLGQEGKGMPQGVFFKAHPKDNDASLCVYKDQNKGYHDFSDHLGSGTIIDFEMAFYKLELKDAIKKLCNDYGIEADKTEFKKSPKRIELAENFEKYRMTGNNAGFSRWFQTRGVDYNKIQEYKEKINEIAKEFGYCENIWISGKGKEAVYKDVIIFPCLDGDEEKTLIGAKLRRTDGEKFKYNGSELKSVSVGRPKDYTGKFKFSTGLIYNKISEDYVIIVEGEADYMILKLLGFESIIGNEGGVSANADKIQSKVKHVKKVISFYDNDSAGAKANRELVGKIGRPIRRIVYPEIEGKDKFDVNDLFKMGYTKKDFDALIENSEVLNLETAEKELKEVKETEKELYQKRFFYDNTKMDYFDVKDFNFKGSYTLARHLFIKPKELEELRLGTLIPTYEGVCYLDGGRENYYNLMDKSRMIHPSKTPEIHPEIKDLISNLCNNNKENILWLLEAILYKYTHLNDVLIPAVVFHGVGGTGKGLFMKLLSEIFGENNTQLGLTQESIESRFSAYSGQKLIVEFKELSVDNTAKGKKNMNKLKTFIMEDKIMIEKKGQDAISTENIAWFIMSSNESKPLQLDSADSGNRRFTIIKTGESVGLKKGGQIAKVLKNKKNVENFLAWLFNKFPDIRKKENILPLENEDKKDLEYLSESVGNLFFKWFENRYPEINKLTNHERNRLIDTYRMDIGEDEWDERYKIQYFNSNLSVRYKVTAFKRGGKTCRGYTINKQVNGPGYFQEGEITNEEK